MYYVLLSLTWISYVVSLGLLINYKDLGANVIHRALFLFLAASVLTDFMGVVFAYLGVMTYLDIHLYTMIFGTTVFIIYSRVLQTPFVKKTMWYFWLGFITLSIYCVFANKGHTSANTLPYALITIVVLFFSLLYFYELFVSMKVTNLTKHFFFWVNSAFLLYFGTTFFVSLFEVVIRTADHNVLYQIWFIQLAATIIFNFMISLGIWKSKGI